MKERKEFYVPLPSSNIIFQGKIVNNALFVNSITSGGPLTVGMTLSGTGIPADTSITDLGNSNFIDSPQGNGGTGVYTITNNYIVNPLLPQTDITITAAGTIYPGTDIDNSTPNYGYDSNGTLLKYGGYDKSYNSNLNGFKVCYNGVDQSQLYFTKYPQIVDVCNRVVSYYSQRGYSLPPPDFPPQFNNLFILSQRYDPSNINISGFTGRDIGIKKIGLKFANNLSIASASIISNVCTLTLNSNPNIIGLSNASNINISGFTGVDNIFNGNYTITGINSNSVSFSLNNSNLTSTTFGFLTNSDSTFIGSFLDVYSIGSDFNNLVPSLYQDNTNRFVNGYFYPIRIPLTTNFNTYINNYGINSYSYYDTFKRMISLNIPNNTSGYLSATYNSNITRYNSTFTGSINGDILTVSNVNTGVINFGSTIYVGNTAIAKIKFANTNIYNGNGSIGTYLLNTATNFPANTVFTSNSDVFNQKSVYYLNKFVGSFILAKRDSFNELVKSDYPSTLSLIQCSPTVEITYSNNESNPLSTNLTSFNIITNYSVNGSVYNGLVLRLINGSTSAFDIYTYPKSFINGFVSGNVDLGITPDQNGSEIGDNILTTKIENNSTSSSITIYDNISYAQDCLIIPISQFNADPNVFYPENANSISNPIFNNSTNNDAYNIIGHEFSHNVQDGNGISFRSFPFEGMSVSAELDGKLSNYSFVPFRAYDIFNRLSTIFRSNWWVFQSDRNSSTNTTYGVGVFWKYLQSQFDTNNQISRRVYDIVENNPNYLGKLFKLNNLFTGTYADVYTNYAGVLLAHSQAVNELYNLNFKDVYFNFTVAMAFMRNNTSIAQEYRVGFPYWVYNTNYVGYSQILTSIFPTYGDTIGSDFWNYINDNLIIPANYETIYTGLQLFDNWVLRPNNITQVIGGYAANFTTNTTAVQGLTVGDPIFVTGYGPGFDGNYTIQFIEFPTSSTCRLIYAGTPVPGPTVNTAPGTIELSKYTRKMRDMSSYVLEVPYIGPNPAILTNTITVSVSAGDLPVGPEFKVGMFQFVSDGTNVGSWYSKGPFTLTSGSVSFSMSDFNYFINTNPKIRLVICNTNIIDYSTLPGGNGLDNYFANPGFTGTVTITRT